MVVLMVFDNFLVALGEVLGGRTLRIGLEARGCEPPLGSFTSDRPAWAQQIPELFLVTSYVFSMGNRDFGLTENSGN